MIFYDVENCFEILGEFSKYVRKIRYPSTDKVEPLHCYECFSAPYPFKTVTV